MNEADLKDSPSTLISLLALRAAESGDRTAYTFGGQTRSFGRMWSDIEKMAMSLVGRSVEHGDRVVLALPNGHDFFTAFYGTQRAGGIAVPIYPEVSPVRVIEMAQLCGAKHIVAPSSTPADHLATWRADAGSIEVLTTNHRKVNEAELAWPRPDDVAFLQYTSGSTGDPKGVQLSHANILTNVRQMIDGMEITPEDRFVSWLPSYHDMGLILMTIVPFYLGAQLFLLPTSLRDTRAWLEAISLHRGTFTASPDFGYRLCLRQASLERDAEHPDLSSLRVALNAAEPVRQSTIRDFHDTFRLENVMVAGYGLAEATVGVSMWKPSTPNRVDLRGAVSVGRPFPGVVITIVDDQDRPLPAGTAGHILVESPAVTRGYFHNPDANDRLFAGPNEIRSGDIGYLDGDGNLYVLSRAKDLIIQAGRSIYPQEIEEVVNAVNGVRYAAAIGVDEGRVEGEQVIVLAEIRPGTLTDESARKSCVVAIVQAVHDRFGFRPARVDLVLPRTIPMTHNGKLRRSQLKQHYVNGDLKDALVYPPRSRS